MSKPDKGYTAAERALQGTIDQGIKARDFSSIADAFFKYGMYLLLIGGDAKVSGLQTFTAGGVKRVT